MNTAFLDFYKKYICAGKVTVPITTRCTLENLLVYANEGGLVPIFKIERSVMDSRHD